MASSYFATLTDTPANVVTAADIERAFEVLRDRPLTASMLPPVHPRDVSLWSAIADPRRRKQSTWPEGWREDDPEDD